jgi:2-polyprenyl-3-methyl-5-hydroxy-6-metoxy-1,4-benzoquinol methylase
MTTKRPPPDLSASAIVEHVVCNLCGADDARLIFPSTIPYHLDGNWQPFRCTHSGYGQHLTVVECRRCGLRYANPRFTQAEAMARYEAVEDPLYLEQVPSRLLSFERRLEHFERFARPPRAHRLLDVGAYTGACVQVAEGRGWEAYGLEPSQWAVRQAQSMDLDVRLGTLLSSPPEPASLDVVTMWDVIEHFSDPLGELRAVARALKPDGWVVVHTMDAQSLFARLMGQRWPWLLEMHLYFFSRKTLTAMLEKAGFGVEHIYAEGRYLRLEYLVTRLEPYSRRLAGLAGRLIRMLGWQERTALLNFGDLMTVYARKKP